MGKSHAMETLLCFLCGKEITYEKNASLDNQKHMFEEHLSEIHETAFEKDFLFAATKISSKQRHQSLNKEIIPTDFLQVQQFESETKDETKFSSEECKTYNKKDI